MSLEGMNDKQRDQFAQGLQQLLNSADPDIRLNTMRMLQKSNPELRFPELESQNAINSALKPMQDENEKLRAEMKEREFREKTEREHQQIVARGLKVDDVQKFMTENGIVNFGTAMEVMEMRQRLATPTAESLSMAGNYDMPGGTSDERKKLFGNPAKWARETAHNLIDQALARRKMSA